MSFAIFLGPSLPIDVARRELNATYYPPAAQGDVYRAALTRPTAIGVIDGYFDAVPAVWHKEILWAMDRGIAVFGAASMGALRAVELSSFGMQGVGDIFDSFASGMLEQDDEVAVAHAGPEAGFRPMSDAMVNVRATLRAAEAAGVISASSRAAIEDVAKSLHYVDRVWPTIFAGAREAELGADGSLDALVNFVRTEAVDQKRLDALALLRTMKLRHGVDSPPPAPVHYRFEHTVAWELLRREARAVELVARETTLDAPGVEAEILEELRVQGAGAAARCGALLRALAIETARGLVGSPSPQTVQETVSAFRRERELRSPSELDAWAVEQRVRDLPRFFEDEALARVTASMYDADAEAVLCDHLRATGQYAALVARVESKRKALAARGHGAAELDDTGLTQPELWQWYFEDRLGCPVPDDLEAWARSAGFSCVQAMLGAVVRERLYRSP